MFGVRYTTPPPPERRFAGFVFHQPSREYVIIIIVVLGVYLHQLHAGALLNYRGKTKN